VNVLETGILSVNWGKCSRCGSYGVLHSHHLIPRWLGGQAEDIIQVCKSCHSRLDACFDYFIKYGKLRKDGRTWTDKEKEKRWKNEYGRKFYRDKRLFDWTPVPKVQYWDNLRCNLRTEHITVDHGWRKTDR